MIGKKTMLAHIKTMLSKHSFESYYQYVEVEKGLKEDNYLMLDGKCPSGFGLTGFKGECFKNDEGTANCELCWENASNYDVKKSLTEGLLSYQYEEFTVKEEHIKLINNMYWSWNYCEFGAPTIDPKRPYGNSNVYNDMATILGISFTEDEDFTPEQENYFIKLHEETKQVLEIILSTKSFDAGEYLKIKNKWIKI